MDGQTPFNGFEIDNHSVFNYQIKPITCIELNRLIDHGQRDLAQHGKTALA